MFISYPHEQRQEGDVERDADSEAADRRQCCQNRSLVPLCQCDPCQAPLHVEHYPRIEQLP